MRSITVAILALGSFSFATKAEAAADPWLTAKVKMELWSTKGVPSTHVMVDTNDGVVTLYGKVPTQADRTLAQEAARKVKGVVKVEDLLQVVPKGEKKEVAKTDADIKTEIENRIKNDPSLSASNVSVKAVDKGVVLLSGKADSFIDNYEAQADAYFVDGVRRVTSEIKAPETFVVEEWAFFSPTDVPAESSREVAKEGALTTAVKEKLSADADVPSTRIFVDTRGAAVSLFGTVATSEQKTSAESDAKAVVGVKSVDNELEIKPIATKELPAKDDAIASRVKKLLGHDKALEKVDVAVANGVVKLTGKAPSSWERAHAALLSREAKGARSIDNEVQVGKN